jgi:acetoin utilization protein AcuC
MRSGRSAVFIGRLAPGAGAFGEGHPLSIPRVATVLALCEGLGWLADGQLRESPEASVAQLEQFHGAEYIAALRTAESLGVAGVEVRERFGVGTRENPLFPGLFASAAATVGGSLLAAELALAGHIVFHPAGGTHHGRPDHASGFCYFNDPVFALRRLGEHGLSRILYVDLDAHHGDGVQDALCDDPRMHTVSIHEAGRWPFTGAADDRGGGRSLNLPVPRGFHDSELRFLMRSAVLPYARSLRPQAVVITCGADGLAGDPLCGLELSNGALWEAVQALAALAPAVVVLGGGGYNPWTVARCWTGLWGKLSGRHIPRQLPLRAQRILQGLCCDLIDEEAIDPRWMRTLADPPREGPIRAAVAALVPRQRRSATR